MMNFEEHYEDSVSPVFRACREGDSDELRALLSNGAHVDSHDNQGWFPVHVAAYSGSAVCLRLVLDAMQADDSIGIDVDVATHDGKTPLILAAALSSAECVGVLMEHNADPTLCTLEGYSAVHSALYSRDDGMLQTLLEYGAKQLQTLGGDDKLLVFIEQNESCMPLVSYAIETERTLGVISTLLDHGASLSVSDAFGVTPLMTAVEYMRVDVVRAFSVRGLTPQIVNAHDAIFQGPVSVLITSNKYHGLSGNAAKKKVFQLLYDHGLCLKGDTLKNILAVIYARHDSLVLRLVLSKIPRSDLVLFGSDIWRILLSGDIGLFEAMISNNIFCVEVNAAVGYDPKTAVQNIVGPLLLGCSSTCDIVMIARLLEHECCINDLISDPVSVFRFACHDYLPAEYMLDFSQFSGQCSRFYARRLWGVLTKLFSALGCDMEPSVWIALIARYANLFSVAQTVICAFTVTQVLMDFPSDVISSCTRAIKSLDSIGQPEAVGIRNRCRHLLRLALLLNPRRQFLHCVAQDEAAALEDLACSPASLLMLCRWTIVDALRQAADSIALYRPKLRHLITKLCRHLPKKVENIVLYGSPELIAALDLVLDVSSGSDWVDPNCYSDSFNDQDFGENVPLEVRNLYDSLLTDVSGWDHISSGPEYWNS